MPPAAQSRASPSPRASASRRRAAATRRSSCGQRTRGSARRASTAQVRWGMWGKVVSCLPDRPDRCAPAAAARRPLQRTSLPCASWIRAPCSSQPTARGRSLHGPSEVSAAPLSPSQPPLVAPYCSPADEYRHGCVVRPAGRLAQRPRRLQGPPRGTGSMMGGLGGRGGHVRNTFFSCSNEDCDAVCACGSQPLSLVVLPLLPLPPPRQSKAAKLRQGGRAHLVDSHGNKIGAFSVVAAAARITLALDNDRRNSQVWSPWPGPPPPTSSNVIPHLAVEAPPQRQGGAGRRKPRAAPQLAEQHGRGRLGAARLVCRGGASRNPSSSSQRTCACRSGRRGCSGRGGNRRGG